MLPNLLSLDRRLCPAHTCLLESATCLQAVNLVNVSRWKVEWAAEPPSNVATFLAEAHHERGVTSDSSVLCYFQVGRG